MIHWLIAFCCAVEPERFSVPVPQEIADEDDVVAAAPDVVADVADVPPVELDAVLRLEEEQAVSEATAMRPAPVTTA